MMSRRVRRRGFTLIELLVVIAIIGMISSMIMPALSRSRGEAQKLQCSANLKNIYTFAMIYADRKNHAFPIARGKQPEAHASLQVLLDHVPDAFEPQLFVCPAGDTVEAEVDEDGRFVLDAETNSYTWVARRTKNSARNRPLCSDKFLEGYEDADGVHSGHDRGMNVAITDGSVRFWDKERLDTDTMLPRGLVP